MSQFPTSAPSSPASSISSSTPVFSKRIPVVEPVVQNIDLDLQGNVLGSKRMNGGLRVGVRDKELFPLGECSTIIHKSFKERVDPNGYNWTNLSKETKEFYWDEFQKKCCWDVAIGYLVKVAWERRAKEKYRQYIYNMSSSTKNPTRKKPFHLKPQVWTMWNAMWNSEEFKKKSVQCKINRRGGVADGQALPTHNSGSASYHNVATKLEKQLGHPPSCYKVFLHTHTKNHDGTTFLNERAKQIHDTFETRRKELLLLGEKVDENELFYEVVGGHDRKRRIYGIGSYGNNITSDKDSFEMYASPDADKDRVETKAKIQKLEDVIEKQGQQYERVKKQLAEFEGVKKQLEQATMVIQNLGDMVKALADKR